MSSFSELMEEELERDYFEDERIPNVIFFSLDFNEIGWDDFQCHLCLITITMPEGLNTHIEKHNPDSILKCERCDYETVIPEKYDEHKYSHLDRLCFECYFCSDQYQNIRELRNHRCLKLSFQCERCHLRLWNYDEQIFHMKKCLFQVFKPFFCYFCKRSFRIPWYTISHILKHIDFSNFTVFDKPRRRKRKIPKTIFFCNKCQYKTDNKANFKIHKMRHQGIKPFKSPICNFSAVITSDLKRHLNAHNTKKRALSCEIGKY